jgi:hypothetical protein
MSGTTRTGPPAPPVFAPEWLRLRETADARARAAELLDPLRGLLRTARLPGREPLVVHDLGCGTGAMGRWLAPRLDGSQHWIVHDRDPRLLHLAVTDAPREAAYGGEVTVEARRGELGALAPDALSGAGLVTASALLDVLTSGELDALADACALAGCPALLTLTVTGRVGITPADPLDAAVTDAFNAHQRRSGLLGPDAVPAVIRAFAERGMGARTRPSPWRLGPGDRDLTERWLTGWTGAAAEQRPELGEHLDAYLARRLEALEKGELRVIVHHADILVRATA